MTSISPIKLDIADKLEKDEKFRKRFFRIQAQDKIAMDIRKLRKKRKKVQADLAKESNMLQSAVSRIEQADYSKWSFTTLLRVADALGARLRVSFEPMEDVIDWYRKKEAVAIADSNQFAEVPPSSTLDEALTNYTHLKFPQHIVAVPQELCASTQP